MKQSRQIFRDAILLTCASLLMRTVGIAFQVAISNRAGAEVMGLYSLMAGVYGFALTLATSGIHLGVTRMVAEFLSFSDHRRIKGFLKSAVIYALIFGTLAAVLLQIMAEPIGARWLSDRRTIPALRILAISLPFLGLSSVFGGYFTAVRKSYKTAVLQISEQLIKISMTLYLFSVLSSPDPQTLLCALVFAGVVAELLSFLIGWLLFAMEKRKIKSPKGEKIPFGDFKALCRITLPMAVTSYIRSGLLTLQHVLIPRGLRKSGASHATALVSYGHIHSMALPVILYPAALISSFSGLLIPTMAECHAQNRSIQIRYVVSRVWFFAMLFSVGTAGILICFSQELGQLLYPNTDADRYIRILAPLIPIMYLDTATDAMLKGLGEQLYSMKINILDALLSVILVSVFVPAMGINGYLIAIYASETFNTVFSVTRLLRISEASVRVLKWVCMPLICILTATYAARLIFSALPSFVSPPVIRSVLHCAVTALIYFALLTVTGTVNREELSWGRGLLCRQSKAC